MQPSSQSMRSMPFIQNHMLNVLMQKPLGSLSWLQTPSANRSDWHKLWRGRTFFLNYHPRYRWKYYDSSMKSPTSTKKTYYYSLGTLNFHNNEKALFWPKCSNEDSLQDHHSTTYWLQDHHKHNKQIRCVLQQFSTQQNTVTHPDKQHHTTFLLLTCSH